MMLINNHLLSEFSQNTLESKNYGTYAARAGQLGGAVLDLLANLVEVAEHLPGQVLKLSVCAGDADGRGLFARPVRPAHHPVVLLEEHRVV